mgnify:CR=1 FL=1
MPRSLQFKGTCDGCRVVLGRMAMHRHLDQCVKLAPVKKSGLVKRLRIAVDAPYASPYWIIVDAHPNATLKELDDFLRELWLECCGHLSSFHVGKQGYALDPIEEFDDRDLGVRISDVLLTGTIARYEYDFGSTTELRIRAGKTVIGPKSGEHIRLLAQNEAPIILCESCKKPATVICAECTMERTSGARCGRCRKRGHECEDALWFDILNSPRTATCGYGGNW